MSVTYGESLNQALHAMFAARQDTYLLGEDIEDPYGGAFKISKGLHAAYPERVRTTPISEATIIGVATGMALRGLRPIAEIMFGDFLCLCADQIINHLTKFPGMYGKELSVPVVIRTPMGGGRGYGATHSQSLEKHFLGVVGLQVVAPGHAHDAGALLQAAVEEHDGPLLFVEHKLLYPEPLLSSGDGLEVTQPEDGLFPTMVISNAPEESPDVTIIAYGGMSRLLVPLLQQMREEEINLEVLLPASLSPLPIKTLAAYAARSGRVLVVEEGMAGFGFGSEVAASLHAALGTKLAAPVKRVASGPGIIPNARAAEDALLVHATQIEEAIEALLI